MKNILLLCCTLFTLGAQAQKLFKLSSPDGQLQTEVNVGEKITYNISRNGSRILLDSPLSMTLEDGTVWGDHPRISRTGRERVDRVVSSPFYRKKEIRECYNALSIDFKKGWGLEFRAYDTGIAYRFVNHRDKPFHITEEEVSYRFPSDWVSHVPYVTNNKQRVGFEKQFMNSAENIYITEKISRQDKGTLMFLPLIVEADEGVKVCLTESDLEDFPGLYLSNNCGGTAFKGIHAPYPKKSVQGGHNMLQMVVQERENYIAKVEGERTFPWRMAIVTGNDRELADNDLVYLLADPSRLDDISWVKPGKVAWEWWSDWNLTGVDFKTGVNNETYKAYIDFAAKNNLEYVILDEGWAVNLKADLMQVVDEINLKELVEYGKSRNVGIILWAGYYAFDCDMEKVCRYYSEMGIKGFKVDFMDRNDQEMVNFVHRAAEMCAKYHLLLDLHGMYNPAGLNRSYPNILNFEGVHGMEQMKWRKADTDQMRYDVMIPFARQVAGPLDYTQGAMRNSTRKNYYPCYSEPMSQGTRCHQLALYVVFESPLTMLCDTPDNYEREQECTDFIAGIPTVWDETRVLDAKLGEYIVTARRSGNTWYIGGITNWTERDLEIDLSFLGDQAQALLYKDGMNAHRNARDYRMETIHIGKNHLLRVHLAPGGGFAIRVK